MSARELIDAAQPIILDAVRQQPCLHFKDVTAWTHVRTNSVRKMIGLAKDDKRDISGILSSAATATNKRLKSFQVQAEGSHYGEERLVTTLTDTAEWDDALREAWSYAEKPNECFLTDPGLALLEYVRSGQLGTEFVRERSISHRMGLYGREGCVEEYLHEIASKTPLNLHWEKNGAHWSATPPMFRIWLEKPDRQQPEKPVGLNPEIDADIDRPTRKDLDAARSAIYSNLLVLNPPNAKVVHFIAISTRKDLRRCFPRLRENHSDALFNFFTSISLNDQLLFGCDFQDEAPIWTVTFGASQDWKKTLAAIQEEIARPSVEERYGLGSEAAKLLTWIEQLPADKKLLGRLTPIVEESNKKWIGLTWPWSEENVAVYLQLLIDEINECTDYDLRLQPWREYGRIKSRIIIRRNRVR